MIFSRIHAGRRWQPWAVLLLLMVLFVQLLSAATRLSATIDEGFHITSGYEYLRIGRMRLLDEHVPLAKALFAWPLFFVPDLAPPEKAAGYGEGDLIAVAQETVLAYRPIDRVIVACRIPVALLTLVLAAVVYRWAADWFGPTAGVFALALLVFDPNILAHGSLATTDMGAVTFIFLTVWVFARYLRRPRAARWWMAALLLGLALGTKLTTLLLLPVLGILALFDIWIKVEKDRPRHLLKRAFSFCGMTVVAGLVLWALYLFEVRPLPEVADGSIPFPAASHIERWLRLQTNIDYGREFFLLGQNGMHGRWQYFPVAFVLKTPVPTLLLTLAAVVALVVGRRRKMGDELTLALFPTVYGALSLTSTITIGYRHLLPVLPFLFVFVSRVASHAKQPHVARITYHVSRIAYCVLLAWYSVATLLISPHYLAYFNAVAGGPDEGYRFLADSNTDWGQTLKVLAEYQARHSLEPVRLSMFTFLDPETYGVSYEPIAPMTGAPPVLPRRFNPEPGLYAISATTLDGVPLPIPSTYDWFRHREPLAKIGHVMFLYQALESRGSWVAQCTTLVAPLTPEAVAEGFGPQVTRQIYFDCEQSWVFPDGGESAGWYAQATPGIDGLRWPMGGERWEWLPDWVQRISLDALRLNYVQPVPGELPAFATWEWTSTPVKLSTSVPQVTLEKTLVFLGYDAPATARPGDLVDVMTYWRVLDLPTRPLSLMLHLTGEDGVPIAVGDGLGIPVDQWQSGDIIAQRHTLAIPADVLPGAYRVYSGAYWLDDMVRLSAENDIAFTSMEIGR